MIRRLRCFEVIILICILVKTLSGKPLNEKQNQLSTQRDARVKRGYSLHGANDFASSVQVSSGVLQINSGDEHSISSDSAINIGHSDALDVGLDLSSINADHFGSLDSNDHLESFASNADPWLASGLSSGFDVWLEPLDDSHATSSLDVSAVPTSSITSTHPVSNHIVNTVFSDDLSQSSHIELPSSQLHTTIGSSSSSIGHSSIGIGNSASTSQDITAISDNIDFSNVADINTKPFVKSYGK